MKFSKWPCYAAMSASQHFKGLNFHCLTLELKALQSFRTSQTIHSKTRSHIQVFMKLLYMCN